jgi:hypothetical protein
VCSSTPTFAGQVHEKARAIKNLINDRLVLEGRKAALEGFGEEFGGDAGRSWSMHHQDRAALGIKFPPALEDEARWDVSAIRDENWVMAKSDAQRLFTNKSKKKAYAVSSTGAATPRTS